MERFCDKCGSLVQGEGKFCPTCGAPLESAVDLSKPMTGTAPMQSAPVPPPAGNPYQSPNAAQMPSYPQSYNNAPVQERTEHMTVGQWVLTLFLSSLVIIGLILLFVWGFSSDTPQPKKNYARAMLVWYAIAVGLVILFCVGMFACVLSCAGTVDWDEIFRSAHHYSTYGMFNFR